MGKVSGIIIFHDWLQLDLFPDSMTLRILVANEDRFRVQKPPDFPESSPEDSLFLEASRKKQVAW